MLSWAEMAGHKKADPLFRGDAGDAVAIPSPAADPSLVRHILYLGGYGRESPYLSTSAEPSVAARFAGPGRIWKTSGEKAEELGARHLGQLESILKTSTTGRARWHNARQRLQARAFVERHAEHLLDFIPFRTRSTAVAEAVRDMFEKT
jgi:hypothetical protein